MEVVDGNLQANQNSKADHHFAKGRRQNGLKHSRISSSSSKLKLEATKEGKGSGMSGARLCCLLGELGYEGAEALDPDSFEWPFQYDDARPILDWICSSLRPSNVLSLSELSQLRSFFSISLHCFYPFLCLVAAKATEILPLDLLECPLSDEFCVVLVVHFSVDSIDFGFDLLLVFFHSEACGNGSDTFLVRKLE